MTDQRSFDDDRPRIINVNEHHMACLLLLDTSGSMAENNKIQNLNDGINRFKEEVCKDPDTVKLTDIAIISFNNSLNVIQGFCPIGEMKPVHMTANGGTNMAPAIQMAIDMVDNQSRLYKSTGATPYKPWILLVTDGEPTDTPDELDNVIQLIQKKEEDKKIKFFSLGVGDYDSKTLHRLSGIKVMKLDGYDFTGFFDWLRMSLRAISQSAPTEKPKGQQLPDDISKDTDPWMD